MRSQRALVAAATAVAACAVAQQAAAVTFGADLATAVPNVAPTCPLGFPSVPGLPLVEVGHPTCTWTYADYTSNTGLFSPITGVVRSVSIRVGAQTGPMRIVVMRWLAQNALGGGVNKVCCVITAATPTFTPTASQVTTLQTNLPVTHDPQPNPGETRAAAQDMLGVTVMDPTTPIPLVDTGAHSGLLLDFVLYPGGQAPALTPLSQGTANGYIVPISADVVAAAENLALTPAVLVTQGTMARVTKQNAVPFLIACRGDARCQGLVQLVSQNTGAAQSLSTDPAESLAAKAKVYGTVSYRIAAGRRATVRVRLTAAGKALMRARSSAKVWVKVSSPNTRARTRRITLRRS